MLDLQIVVTGDKQKASSYLQKSKGVPGNPRLACFRIFQQSQFITLGNFSRNLSRRNFVARQVASRVFTWERFLHLVS